MATWHQDLLLAIDTVVQNTMQDPETVFLASLEPGLFSLRDAALANGLGPFDRATNGLQIDWVQGEQEHDNVLLGTAIAADTTTEFDVEPIGAMETNMLIKFLDEIVQVVSVDYTAGTCEVTRGACGTTAESSIAVTDKGYILSTTGTSGGDAGDATHYFGGSTSNYVHLFEQNIQLEDVLAELKMKTPEAAVAYQLQQKFSRIGRMFGNALYHSAATAVNANPRTMNGIRAQITTHTSTSVGALLFADIDTAVQDILDSGGVPTTIWVPPVIKKGLAQWAGNRLGSSIQQADRAGGYVGTFMSATGHNLEVVVDQTLKTTDVLIGDPQFLRAGWVPMLPNTYANVGGVPQQVGLRAEVLARTGAATKIQILGYGCCCVERERCFELLSGVTSVDSDGV